MVDEAEGRPPEKPPMEGVVLTPAQLKSRKMRNYAIGLLVAAVCVLFYVMTIAKLGGNGVISQPG